MEGNSYRAASLPYVLAIELDTNFMTIRLDDNFTNPLQQVLTIKLDTDCLTPLPALHGSCTHLSLNIRIVPCLSDHEHAHTRTHTHILCRTWRLLWRSWLCNKSHVCECLSGEAGSLREGRIKEQVHR